jgi:hypothetical protein
MPEIRLTSIVEARRLLRTELRRLVFAVGVVAATAATVAALVAAGGESTELVVVDRPVVLRVPAPRAPEPPPQPPAPAPVPRRDPLACPVVVETSGKPIGARVSARELAAYRADRTDDPPTIEVAAAAEANELALRFTDGHVRVSDDDGASFRAAFEGREVDQIAIALDGVVYARAGIELGVRTLDGHERWRRVPAAMCTGRDMCHDRIAVVDDRVVWIHDGALAVSADRGATWRAIDTKDQAWAQLDDGRLFAWGGALYLVEHYTDMCGVDDYPVYRLDPLTRAIEHTIFHNYYTGAEPLAELAAGDDVAAQWTWTANCWVENEARHDCSPRRKHGLLLAAKTLLPAEGARTLAVYEGSLVEVCTGGARQIYRRFPFGELAATDHLGRPLVVARGAVLRWSATDGWRRLAKEPAPPLPTVE